MSFFIIFNGEILSGYDLNAVKDGFAHLEKLPRDITDTVFSGASYVLKDELHGKDITDYFPVLEKIGMKAYLMDKHPQNAQTFERNGFSKITDNQERLSFPAKNPPMSLNNKQAYTTAVKPPQTTVKPSPVYTGSAETPKIAQPSSSFNLNTQTPMEAGENGAQGFSQIMGRYSRICYLLVIAILSIGYIVISLISSRSHLLSSIMLLLKWTVMVVYILLAYYRLKDIGIAGWFALILIPGFIGGVNPMVYKYIIMLDGGRVIFEGPVATMFVFCLFILMQILLITMPGQKESNKYSPPDKFHNAS